MLRVALVALSVRGAMGQYVEALAAALQKVAHVELFVPEHHGRQDNEAEPGDGVHRFRTGDTRWAALLRLLNPAAARSVWERVRAVRPDVVHLFNGEGYPWALLWARWAERDGIPFVVTLHDPVPHPGNPWERLNAIFRPYTLRRAAAVHVHAACFIEAAVAQGARRDAVFVIPHGSLAARFLRHRREGVQREPLVLFFGRLEGYKGLETLIEAAPLLGGGLRVAIGGPGRMPAALRARVESRPELFEVHNRYLSDQEVARLFQRAAVCVLPYRQASQSSVPLIAAAFGVPVVASAVGAFVEDVPRVGGLLVAPGQPAALADAITAALGCTPRHPPELDFANLAGEFGQMYAAAIQNYSRAARQREAVTAGGPKEYPARQGDGTPGKGLEFLG